MDFETYPKQYWHCHLMKKKSRGEKYSQEGYINDAHLDRIVKEIILPWRESRRFAVSGLFVQDPSEVEKIQIVHTSLTSSQIVDRIEAQFDGSNIIMPLDSRHLAFSKDYCTDHTTDFLLANTPTMQVRKSGLGAHAPKSRFERSFIRLLIKDIIKTDPDLDAFCLDKFEHVFHKFTGQMDRTTKLNILLQQDLDKIYEALKSMYPDEVREAEE